MDVLVLDVDKLDAGHRALVVDRAMRTRDMDNQRFLRKVQERLERCCPAYALKPVAYHR